MACDNRIRVDTKSGEVVHVECGRCYNCKKRLVRQWIYRLQIEDKASKSAHFVTLTYSSESLKWTESGMPTLSKKDVQDFVMRLRKDEKELRYYIVGEYGSKNWRPHYHAILFNCEEYNIRKAWILNGVPIGSIDVGTVSGHSIAYTVKYMDKKSRIPRFKGDDRQPEFSLKSKGIGRQFLTDAMKKYLQADYTRNYVVNEFGYKVPLPKFYVDNVFDWRQRLERRLVIMEEVEKVEQERMERFFRLYGYDGDLDRYEKYLDDNRKMRSKKLGKLENTRLL